MHVLQIPSPPSFPPFFVVSELFERGRNKVEGGQKKPQKFAALSNGEGFQDEKVEKCFKIFYEYTPCITLQLIQGHNEFD